MARFGYVDGTSFFHRMDPTWKLLWNLVIVGMVILSFDLVYALGLFLYVLALTLTVAHIPLRRYARSITVFLGMGLFVALWKSLYSAWAGYEAVHVWYSWGPINVTREGVYDGAATLARVIAIASVSLLFTLTTDPSRLVDSLIQVAGLPYRIGYVAYAALRFIPLYDSEVRTIKQAHQIRGVGEDGRGVVTKLRLYRSLLVPLLVSGIRRAQATSIAMDSRAFGAYGRRTVVRKAEVSHDAKAFVLAHVPAAAAAFYYFVMLGNGVQIVR